MAMREPTYYVLAALLDGPLHGYAIIRKVERLSGGRLKPAVGTLYGALDRLLDQGLIAIEREEIVDGRARRTYGLTDEGETAVRDEAARLAEASRVVLAVRERTA
jgi:PadR family transcriptional regulator, regulatory protein PadR